jgi:dolichyl-phosphate beta-glucosyltransferase
LPELDLSVVVPCYNEQARLPGSLASAQRYLRERGGEYELVLADDGSTDGTARLIDEAVRAQRRVRAVRLAVNRGKGRAVAEAVRVTRGALVLISDADFSAPIDELPKLERAIELGADVAFGSRAWKGVREVDQPLLRRGMGRVFNQLVRTLLLPGVADSQCGFKLFRGQVARELFSRLRIDGFAFDVEVLYRARRAGYRITEVPVRWLDSRPTRVSAVRDSVTMLRDVVRLRLSSDL